MTLIVANEVSTPRQPPPRPRRGGRARRILVRLFVAGVIILVAVAGTGLYLQQRLVGNLHRIDGAFAGLTHRPSGPPGSRSLNILLVGTDRNDEPAATDDAPAPPWAPGARRTDSVMVLHIDGDRRGAAYVSIPRDTLVEVPGHGNARISEALADKEPSVTVSAVEKLTGVRIDHLAVLDWGVFQEFTDQLGGLTITVPETVRDPARNLTWNAGQHTLDGRQAMDYVGQRAGLPGGNLGQIHRQQYFVRLLMENTLHQEMRHQPIAVYHLLDAISRHLSLDAGWSTGELRSLTWSMRLMTSYDIDYLTLPLARTGTRRGAAVSHPDRVGNASLWRAVRSDDVRDWLSAHPASQVPEVVR